jgi:hypothetical protein
VSAAVAIGALLAGAPEGFDGIKQSHFVIETLAEILEPCGFVLYDITIAGFI